MFVSLLFDIIRFVQTPSHEAVCFIIEDIEEIMKIWIPSDAENNREEVIKKIKKIYLSAFCNEK